MVEKSIWIMLNRFYFALVGPAVRNRILNVDSDMSGLFRAGRFDDARKLRFDRTTVIGQRSRITSGSPPDRCPMTVVLLKHTLN